MVEMRGARKGHGTRARYESGCRCDGCRLMMVVHGAKEPRGLIDAAPYSCVVQDLYRRGETIQTMALETGLSWGCIEGLLFEERPHIQARTAVKLQALIEMLPP